VLDELVHIRLHLAEKFDLRVISDLCVQLVFILNLTALAI